MFLVFVLCKVSSLSESDYFSIISVLIGGFLAIIGSVIAVITQSIVNSRKRKKELLEIEDYFFTSLDFILSSMEELKASITKLSNNLTQYSSLFLSVRIPSGFSTEDLREIDGKTLYRIIVASRKGDSKRKSEDMINIMNGLRYIDRQVKEIEEFNGKLLDSLNEHVEVLNEALIQINFLYNEFTVSAYKNKVFPGNDSFLDLLEKVLGKNQQEIINSSDKSNFKVIYSGIIEPILLFIRSNKDLKDERIVEMIPCLIKGKQAYNESESIRKESINTLSKYISNLNSVQILMKECKKTTLLRELK
ncbi:hypothetical protein DN752_17905 [Echinicola strongylocentroti]|uniref:Uncharacterized protein n=1 Tax=Echinicola strongylocentroti TaxID=1795355 RepID=A0A2Z4ILP4_9BACT|nr:hypothetical protein DN752_17905 [Echinicola strongylocentroti]